MSAPDQNALVPTARIAQTIFVIRGQKVIIDADLAALYGIRDRNAVRELMRPLGEEIRGKPLDGLLWSTSL